MTEQAFNKIIRVCVGVVSLFMWVVSIYFSTEGFGFTSPEYKWIGYGLAMGVTVFELLFNERQKLPLVLQGVGLLCYGYALSTNILGFWLAQNKPDYYAQPWLLVIAVLFSLVIELAPAPSIMFSLGVPARDFLHGVTGKSPKSSQFPPQMQVQSFQPKSYPMKGTVANKHGHP